MKEKSWPNLTVEETLAELKSSQEGLSSEEVKIRHKKYGFNRLPRIVPPKIWLTFLLQFANPLIYILIGVTVVTLILHQYIDTFVILGIIILNAIIGFLQEIKAEHSLEKLEELLSLHCKVIRDDEPHEIDASELTLGDVVLIESGTKVPADLRIIENTDLRVDESILTGEALAAVKSTTPINDSVSLGDQHNILFSGTFITSGRGKGIVVAIADKTEFGKIAASLKETTPPLSPLQIQLAKLTKQIIIIVIISMILILIIGLLRHLNFIDMLLTIANLAVSVIPEGLPAVLTITLAVGVRRMAKQKAIIRYLSAVEALGSMTLVATDKTGTLTRNEMEVEQIYLAPNYFKVSGEGYIPKGNFHLNDKQMSPNLRPALKNLLINGVLCNDASLIQEGQTWKIIGDPTEGALIVAAAKAGYSKVELEEKFTRLDEIPFHTAKRFMATLHQDRDGSRLISVKGAAEKIIPMCNTYYNQERQHRLNTKMVHEFNLVNKELAGQGYRILAIAMRKTPNLDKVHEHDLTQCTLLGFYALSDSPRSEAHRAISQAQRAGIRVVMMTGDHALTAQSIAAELDITHEADTAEKLPVITGQQLDNMTDRQLQKVIQYVNIYARISPLNKLALVRQFQKLGHLVAVTGDGINDAPALKQANIGIAMGKTGTDISREASDMVLANDNFATIIRAIEEGRNVYQNIKRVLLYLLSTNIGEVLTIGIALLIGSRLLKGSALPLIPIQILWINLLTDGAGTIPLALEPKHANIMNYPPRAPDSPLLDRIIYLRIFLVAMVMAIGTLGLYSWELRHGTSLLQARTVAFEAMVLFQIFNMFNCRSLKESVFRLPIFNNLYIIWAFIAAWGLTIFAIYLPFMQRIFHTTGLSPMQWLRIIIVSYSIIIIIEIEKWWRRRYHTVY